MDITVREIMRSHPIAVSPDDTIRYAFARLCALRIRHLLVMEGDQLAGIVTDRDIRLALPSLPFVPDIAEIYLKLDDVKVRDVMTCDVVTVPPEASLATAIDMFLQRQISALPVVEGKRVVGIVTETDVLRVMRRFLNGSQGQAKTAGSR